MRLLVDSIVRRQNIPPMKLEWNNASRFSSPDFAIHM